MSAPRVIDAVAQKRLDRAYAAFVDLLKAGLRPTLTSEVQDGNYWFEGEYDVVVAHNRYRGLLHEDVQAAVQIAEKHGGRVWVGLPDGNLSILFPDDAGVEPREPDAESPAGQERRASRSTPTPKRKTRSRKAPKT